MAVTIALPQIKEIADTLTDLLGKKADAKAPAAALSAGAADLYLVATYTDDQGVPVAAALCDLPFSAFASAALAMIPLGVAKDSIKDKKLSAQLMENIKEILNIYTSVLKPTGGRVKLGSVVEKAGLSADVNTFISRADAKKVDAELAIPAFGPGKITFLA